MKRIILLFVLLASAICATATSVDYHFSYSMQAGSVFGTLNTIDEGGRRLSSNRRARKLPWRPNYWGI